MTSANTTQGTSSDVAAAARRVLEEIFPACDDAALAEAVSEDFINHEAPPGTPPGPAAVSMFMHLLDAAFSGQRWTIHRVLVDGEYVALHCTHSGRHTGEFFGMPATGRDFAYRQMHIIRVVNGKGAEHWAVRDDTTLMRQLTSTGPA